MSVVLTIIIFIVVLSFLTIIHELGHFSTAKWRKVKVLEFGIGFPPRIFAFRRGETEYSINAIPFGGFTKMLGEEDPAEPRSLARQGSASRILILSAGSLVMLLFPLVMFSIVYMVPHPVVVGGEGIEVTMVSSDSPAEAAGLEVGDEILEINGKSVKNFDELQKTVNDNLGQEITMVVERQSEEQMLEMVPRPNPPPDEGALGIGLSWSRIITETEWLPPWEAVAEGAKQTWDMVDATARGIIALFQGQASREHIGIIPVIQETGRLASMGIMPVLQWTGLLSIFLGVMNLLPIPALDGGRIAFVLVEKIRRGKRISPQKEGLIHLIAFVFLNAAGVMLILYFDLPRLFSGLNILP
ncbi:MAG: M50 family metallopeptidase [Dehalococcoidia bacterium]